jgi:hypothetical protein
MMANLDTAQCGKKHLGRVCCCKRQLKQLVVVPKCITLGLAIQDLELFEDELDAHCGVPPR